MIYRRFPTWDSEDEMWCGGDYQGHYIVGHIDPYRMLAEMLDGWDYSGDQVRSVMRQHGKSGFDALMSAMTHEWACLCMDVEAFDDFTSEGKDPLMETWDIFHVHAKPDPMPLDDDGEPLYMPVTMLDVYRMNDALRLKAGR